MPGGGVRSLPMTPPGLTERPQVTISCPDGLAHALSEENIRLQQIVHEHKVNNIVSHQQSNIFITSFFYYSFPVT